MRTALLFASLAAAAGGYVHVGVDLGTSGARVAVLTPDRSVAYTASQPWPSAAGASDPAEWTAAVRALVAGIPAELRRQAAGIAVDGTSSSVLPVGPGLAPLAATRMYDYAVPPEAHRAALALMDAAGVPSTHTVRAASSTLSKALEWALAGDLAGGGGEVALCHQADYVEAALLGTSTVTTDWHNALKLGYDVGALRWPAWMTDGPIAAALSPAALPAVVEPGTPLGVAAPEFGLGPSCVVGAGTTDSIAAFLAAGADKPGDAVTSLGSTTALKLLSTARADDAALGVYSHRLWQDGSDAPLWLVGGASNAGCAVLRAENFEVAELEALSAAIDPATDTPLRYYPLTKPGERFPVNDPAKEGVLGPVPADRKDHLHAILQGIADVEADGYAALRALGATRLERVFTAGGGAANSMWREMRARKLGVPVVAAADADAASGAAVLAGKAAGLAAAGGGGEVCA